MPGIPHVPLEHSLSSHSRCTLSAPMDGNDRLHCLLIAATNQDILYERFYDHYGELEKADVRLACAKLQEQLTQQCPESVGRFRWVS